MAMTLSTKQKQFLKGLAHHLNSVVMLGGNGLTEGVLAEIDNALTYHELIKVKIAGADRESKQLIINAIVRETKAAEVQSIGTPLRQCGAGTPEPGPPGPLSGAPVQAPRRQRSGLKWRRTSRLRLSLR